MAKKRFETDDKAAGKGRQSAAALMLKRIQSPVPVEAPPSAVPQSEVTLDEKIEPPVSASADVEPAEETGADEPASSSSRKKKRYQTALGKQRLMQLGSPEQDEELDDFRRDIKRVSGQNPSVSLLARIGLSIIMRSKQEIIDELRAQEPPPWAPARDGKAFSKYEDYWDRVCGRATLRRVDS